MGIDIAFGSRLIEAAPLVIGKKTGVMLGRQRLNIKPGERRFFRRALRHAGLVPDYGLYAQEDGYAERFLEGIGFPKTQSLDFSDYEDCDFTHDLNEPLPKNLKGKFDVVIDGGTIEHVFNTPQALDNVFHMLKDGGIFISINGMTGWAGHGFYQFSPELVWRYWQDTRRCKIHSCAAVSVDPTLPLVPVQDTGKAGSRFRGLGLKGRWYLYYVVEKMSSENTVAKVRNIQQGDYVVRWNETDQTND